MKRFLSIFIALFIILNFSACSNTKNEKTIKIGVIDSCISSEIQSKYDITEMNDMVGVQTDNNITHGSMILSIILQNVSNCEIFYCSVYDEKCIGKIDDVANAINWCIDNNVDIITMSFATLTDNEYMRECVKKAIDNNILITASCINLSDKTCYPAMYDDVISVSEGINNQASVILKGKAVQFTIDGIKMEKRGVSFLTAYVCGKIANKLSEGIAVEKIVKDLNFE